MAATVAQPEMTMMMVSAIHPISVPVSMTMTISMETTYRTAVIPMTIMTV